MASALPVALISDLIVVEVEKTAVIPACCLRSRRILKLACPMNGIETMNGAWSCLRGLDVGLRVLARVLSMLVMGYWLYSLNVWRR